MFKNCLYRKDFQHYYWRKAQTAAFVKKKISRKIIHPHELVQSVFIFF